MGRRSQSAEVASRKDSHMIDIRISAEERGPLRVDQPGDLGVRIGSSNRGDRGKRVHHVAERTWLDDKNGFAPGHYLSPLPLLVRLWKEAEDRKKLTAECQPLCEQPRQAR